MSKVVLNDITGSYGSVAALNALFDLISTGFDNTLSRDGTSPNTMLADIDLNNNDLLNVQRVNATEFLLNGTLLAPAGLVAEDASQITFTPDGTGAIPTTVEDKLRQTISVKDYIPASLYPDILAGTSTVDVSSYLQAALDAAAYGVLDFGNAGARAKFRTESTLNITGYGTTILGRNAIIDYYGTAHAIGFNLLNGTTYNTEITIDSLAIYLNAGTSTSGILLQTSYSVFNKVNVLIRAGVTNGKGITLVGDETNGTGPYYNRFDTCQVQGVDSTDHTGFFMSSTTPLYRSANANTWIGGRVGQCAVGFHIEGNGNSIYNVAIENVDTTNGICYQWNSPAANTNTQNRVHGGYIENGLIGYQIEADVNNAVIETAYITGLGTVLDDSSTTTSISGGTIATRSPTGIQLTGLIPSTDVNTLDYYEEGAWIPTLVGGTTPGDYTIASTTAQFVRIGRQVTVSALLTVTINTPGTGTLRFGGLPYPKGALQFLTGNVTTNGVVLNAAIQNLSCGAWTNGSDSTFIVSGSRTAAAPLDLQVGDITSGDTFIVAITYFV